MKGTLDKKKFMELPIERRRTIMSEELEKDFLKEQSQSHFMKYVRVNWIDSMLGDNRWQLREDFDFEEPLRISSFGQVIVDKKDYIVLASNIAHNQASQFITIPKVSIESIDKMHFIEKLHTISYISDINFNCPKCGKELSSAMCNINGLVPVLDCGCEEKPKQKRVTEMTETEQEEYITKLQNELKEKGTK